MKKEEAKMEINLRFAWSVAVIALFGIFMFLIGTPLVYIPIFVLALIGLLVWRDWFERTVNELVSAFFPSLKGSSQWLKDAIVLAIVFAVLLVLKWALIGTAKLLGF